MKIGVILFNMGGPDSLEAVKPFLYNLFSDSDIVRFPKLLQKPLAFLISTLRARKTKKYYELMGGKSPQKEQTQKQAEKLQEMLGDDYKVVVALRYWHPFTEEALQELFKEPIRALVLLPLYPQYSRTTTGSSFNEFDRVFRKIFKGKSGRYMVLSTLKGQERPYYYSSFIPIVKVNCYYNHPTYIKAMVENIREHLPDWKEYFFLFTAHSLPVKVVQEGDPYQKQTEETVRLIMEHFPGVRYALGYQSKVGPTKWLEPFTDELLKDVVRSGVKKIALIPVSFTCEHSETLYELDHLYGNMARQMGVNSFVRIPTLQTHPLYIKALAELVHTAESLIS
ncbi:ferrochelatase [Thermocrinis minervae]|uniref:Ferrochelatase n=1 Tax=Thermocrinis minervae TaxID=381751 RepID=A0A1M6TET3_9AQUI|nr:ferrochelatase [Thermocrinis minervae]SHK55346.1 ferrochelatase [Thermocrinis minervae]